MGITSKVDYYYNNIYIAMLHTTHILLRVNTISIISVDWLMKNEF